MRPFFFQVRYFIWVIVPLALWLAAGRYGVPHIFYAAAPSGAHQPASCHFFGFYGAVEAAPVHGHCPWVRFVPLGSHRQ